MASTDSSTPVDSSTYFGLGTAATATKTQSTLDMESFVKLLTVQLENQNPLEPMTDRDFFAQMAQLGQVQGMETLNKSSEMQQAQSLMGKTVTGSLDAADAATAGSSSVTGVVTKMSVKNGVYYLGVQEANGGVADIKISSLTSIVPNPDLTQYNGLIGKEVAGTGSVTTNGVAKDVEAVGKVLGVSADSGTVYLQVQTTDNGVVPVPVSKLEHITS